MEWPFDLSGDLLLGWYSQWLQQYPLECHDWRGLPSGGKGLFSPQGAGDCFWLLLGWGNPPLYVPSITDCFIRWEEEKVVSTELEPVSSRSFRWHSSVWDTGKIGQNLIRSKWATLMHFSPYGLSASHSASAHSFATKAFLWECLRCFGWSFDLTDFMYFPYTSSTGHSKQWDELSSLLHPVQWHCGAEWLT